MQVASISAQSIGRAALQVVHREPSATLSCKHANQIVAANALATQAAVQGFADDTRRLKVYGRMPAIWVRPPLIDQGALLE